MSQVSQVSHFLKVLHRLTRYKATFHLSLPFPVLTLPPARFLLSPMSQVSQRSQTRLIAQAKSHNNR